MRAIGKSATRLTKEARRSLKEIAKWPLYTGVFFLLFAAVFSHTNWVDYLFTLNGAQYSVERILIPFSEALGVAFIISFIIASLIEKKAREEHGRLAKAERYAVAKNVLQAVYQLRVPPNVYAEIESCILEHPFIRRQAEITYSFITETNAGEPEDIDKVLIAYTNIRFFLENISSEEKTFDFNIELDVPLARAFIDRVRVKRISIDARDLTVEELEAARNAVPDTDLYVRYRHSISVSPGVVRSVEADYTMVKLMRDTDTWRSFIPTAGVNVIVSMPEEIKECHAHAAHRNSFTERHTGNLYRWELDGVVLPYQGFTLWWTY